MNRINHCVQPIGNQIQNFRRAGSLVHHPLHLQPFPLEVFISFSSISSFSTYILPFSKGYGALEEWVA